MDDLRNEHPRVQNKLIAMTKSLISSTDIDGIRMDTPMQVPCLSSNTGRLPSKRTPEVSARTTSSSSESSSALVNARPQWWAGGIRQPSGRITLASSTAILRWMPASTTDLYFKFI